MAVTTWRYGSTATATADGDGRVTNPTYALAVDSQWATFTSFAAQRLPTNNSGYLRVANFGFAGEIPTGATITGVEVECQRSTFADNGSGYGGGTWIKDQSVTLALTTSNFPVGSNRADVGLWTPGAIRQASLEVASTIPRYGGETDLWGQSISRAAATSANFAVLIQAVGVSDIHIGYVNFVRMRVHYRVGLPARSVTANGTIKAVGAASAKQIRRSSKTSASGSITAKAIVSAGQVRRLTTVIANGLVAAAATGYATQTKRQSSATASGLVTPHGSVDGRQIRRTISATLSGSVAPQASASVVQSVRPANVTSNGLVSATGSMNTGQIRRLSTVTAHGLLTVSSKATAKQARRNPATDITGQIILTAKASVSSRRGTRLIGIIEPTGFGHAIQIRPDVRMFVDPARVVVVPQDNRMVAVPADSRSVTVPQDNRSVSIPANERAVTVPHDGRMAK